VWGTDQVGVEAGLQWHDTSLSLSVVNGLTPEPEGGQVVGVGIIPDENASKDIQVFANQILGPRSGISALYWHGTVDLPVDPAGFIDGSNDATYLDHYDRMALFGSIGSARLIGLVGAELGIDQARDPVSGERSRFNSGGAYAEGDVAIVPGAVGFLRLDYFDPSTDKDDNEVKGVVAGAALYHEWLEVTPELQLRSTSGAMGDKVESIGLVHAIVIY
jgi:hypothetical protein